MANNKPFKVKNGLIASRYLQNKVDVQAIATYEIGESSNTALATLDASSQSTTMISIRFKPDGTKLYITDATRIYEYDLSTAWDISTASFLRQGNETIAATSAISIFFKPNGTYIYTLDNTAFAGTRVNQDQIFTAWNVNTINSISFRTIFSVDSQITTGKSLFFKPDGSKFYILDSTETIFQYSLTTPWDISTASYDTVTADVSSEISTAGDIYFTSDGTKLFVTSYEIIGGGVFQYSLTTPWDLSTLSYDDKTITINGTYGFDFNPDLSSYYRLGSNDTVSQYDNEKTTEIIDLSLSDYFTLSPSGSDEFVITNLPEAGVAKAFVIEINNPGNTITWPNNIKWHEGITPTSTATKELYTFIVTDGSTIYGRKAAENLQ